MAGSAGGEVLEIQLDRSNDSYVVCRPAGEVDASTVCKFRETLAELAHSSLVLIDMSGVSFIDSAGLGALIGGIRRTREFGGDVAVVCGRPGLTRLLCTVGFDRIVVMAQTVEEVLAAWETDASPIDAFPIRAR
jgi:anti-sigma B factor antagonist